MAAEQEFKARISVTGNAAEKLSAINARMETLTRNSWAARQMRGMRDLGAQTAKLAGNVTGLGTVSRLAVSGIYSIGVQAVQAAASLATMGAGLSAAGLVTMSVQASAAGAALNNMSQRTGIALGQLQRFQYYAGSSGISAETLSGALNKLNSGMALGVAGRNRELASLFRKLGISMTDARGRVRSLNEVMPLLANAFRNNTNPAEQARMAMALFGRAGVDMIPMLQGGAAGLRELSDRFDQLGGPVSDRQISALAEMDNLWGDLKTSLQSLGLTIAAELVPVMKPVVDGLAVWVGANREWLATSIAEKVGTLVEWLKQIDWSSLGTRIVAIGQGFLDMGRGAVALIRPLTEAHGPMLALGAAGAGLFLAFSVSRLRRFIQAWRDLPSVAQQAAQAMERAAQAARQMPSAPGGTPRRGRVPQAGQAPYRNPWERTAPRGSVPQTGYLPRDVWAGNVPQPRPQSRLGRIAQVGGALAGPALTAVGALAADGTGENTGSIALAAGQQVAGALQERGGRLGRVAGVALRTLPMAQQMYDLATDPRYVDRDLSSTTADEIRNGAPIARHLSDDQRRSVIARDVEQNGALEERDWFARQGGRFNRWLGLSSEEDAIAQGRIRRPADSSPSAASAQPPMLPAMMPAAMPAIYGAGTPPAGGSAPVQAEVRGAVETVVRFENAPPGMRVDITGTGITAEPQANVGYAQSD